MFFFYSLVLVLRKENEMSQGAAGPSYCIRGWYQSPHVTFDKKTNIILYSPKSRNILLYFFYTMLTCLYIKKLYGAVIVPPIQTVLIAPLRLNNETLYYTLSLKTVEDKQLN